MKSMHVLRIAAAITVFSALSMGQARAAIITLEDGNSTAIFHTEATDGGTLGLNTWSLDDGNDQVDHMFQQWFWHRVGSHTREWAIDGTGPLVHLNSTSMDLDGDLNDEFLISNYSDTESVLTPEQYSVQLRYLLTGGTLSSHASDIVEVIRVKNLGTSPMEFHLFQFVDFDLNETISDDRLILTGTPINTATQSDPINIIGETVVTPPPSRYQVAPFSDIRDELEDLDIDDLTNTVGPIVGDATWAFQWDFSGTLVIPPGGTAIISKDKNIRPGDGGIIPEPSSALLASIGVAFLYFRRRN